MDEYTAIIDDTFFTGMINIDTSRDEVKDMLNEVILDIQTSYFKKLFGNSMFAEIVNDQTVDKYKELIEGGFTYTNGTTNIYYSGIQKMLANIVYFYFTQQQQNSNSYFGNVEPVPSGGRITSATDTLIYVWNEAVNLWDEAKDYINYKNNGDNSTYPQFANYNLKKLNSLGI